MHPLRTNKKRKDKKACVLKCKRIVITATETAVTIPYMISGADMAVTTQVSVLILSREYMPGNTNSADIICYKPLGNASAAGGTFRIPEGYS